jgi:outer membrane protein assembly factor BamB
MSQRDVGQTSLSPFTGPSSISAGPAWSVDLGGTVYTSPVISAEGIIYVVATRGPFLPGPSSLYAFKPNGKFYVPPVEVPGVPDLVVLDESSGLLYLRTQITPGMDIITYSKKLDRLTTVFHSELTANSPTIVSDGTLYFTASDVTSANPLYLIAAGNRNWRIPYCPSEFASSFTDGASPVVLSADGTALYAVCTSEAPREANKLFKFDAVNGTTIASVPYQPNATAPLLDGRGRLYVGFALVSAAGGGFDVFDLNLNHVASNPGDVTTGHAILLSNGDVLKRSTYQPSVLSRRGLISWDVDVGVLNTVPASDHEGKIFINSVSSQLKVLAPDGSTLSTYQLPNGLMTQQPVISGDGTLYVANVFGSKLFAFRDTPLTTGTITAVTNLSNATFTITGPANYAGTGNSFGQTNAASGTYTIVFGPVPGFTAPSPQTLALSPGETISFSGTYAPIPQPVPAAELRVDQTPMNFDFERGKAAPVSQALLVSSDRPITFSITVLSSGWLTTSVKTGSTPAQVAISVNATGMDPGHYSGLLIIGDLSIVVNLYVRDPPRLLLSRESVSFLLQKGGPPPLPETVYVNSTTRHVNVSAAKPAVPWISVSPDSGMTWLPFTISVNPAGLAPGTYTTMITLSSAEASNSPQAVPVTLQVVEIP